MRRRASCGSCRVRSSVLSAAMLPSSASDWALRLVTPIQICLAWDAGRRSALIADFADAVAPTTRDAASSGQTA
jgi:hypothetical protein